MMGMMGGRMMGMRGRLSNVPNGAPLRLITLRTRARRGPAFRMPERLSSFNLPRGHRAPMRGSDASRCRFSGCNGCSTAIPCHE